MSMIYHVGPGAGHTVSVDVDAASSRVRLSVDGRVELDKQVTDSLVHDFQPGGPNGRTLRLAVSAAGWQLNANLYADGELLRPVRSDEAAAPEPMLPPGMSGVHRIHSPNVKPTYERKWDWGNPAAITCLVLAALCLMATVVLALFLPMAHPNADQSWSAEWALPLLLGGGINAGFWLLLAIGIARKSMWRAVLATVLASLIVLGAVIQLVLVLARIREWDENAMLVLFGQIICVTISIAVLALMVSGINRIREQA